MPSPSWWSKRTEVDKWLTRGWCPTYSCPSASSSTAWVVIALFVPSSRCPSMGRPHRSGHNFHQPKLQNKTFRSTDPLSLLPWSGYANEGDFKASHQSPGPFSRSPLRSPAWPYFWASSPTPPRPPLAKACSSISPAIHLWQTSGQGRHLQLQQTQSRSREVLPGLIFGATVLKRFPCNSVWMHKFRRCQPHRSQVRSTGLATKRQSITLGQALPSGALSNHDSVSWNQARTATWSQNNFWDTIASCRKESVACRETGAD